MKKSAALIMIFLLMAFLLAGPYSARAFSGKGTQDAPFVLRTVADMLKLQERVNGGDTCEGVYFKLGGNIVLNAGMSLDLEWMPLIKFAGVLDGAGFSLSGLYVPSAYEGKFNPALGFGSGLIAELETGGRVSNLTVSGRIDDPWYNEEIALAGGIAANNNGLIEDCKAYITFYRSYADFSAGIGGISGTNGWEGVVKNCRDESMYYEDPGINIVSGVEAGFKGVTGFIDFGMGEPPVNNVDLARNMGYRVPAQWNQFGQTVPEIFDEGWLWPVPAMLAVISPYNIGHKALQSKRNVEPKYVEHDAIDINTNRIHETVLASRSGWVVDVVPDGEKGGKACKVEVYSLIDGYLFRARYLHLQSGTAVPIIGQWVRQGDMIANVGNTGNVTGTDPDSGIHLHFSIYKSESRVNEEVEEFYECASEKQSLSAKEISKIKNYKLAPVNSNPVNTGIVPHSPSNYTDEDIHTGAEITYRVSH